jgi:hypothetical protein
LRLERDDTVHGNGAALTGVRRGAVGGNNLDIEFCALVVEIEDVRR